MNFGNKSKITFGIKNATFTTDNQRVHEKTKKCPKLGQNSCSDPSGF